MQSGFVQPVSPHLPHFTDIDDESSWNGIRLEPFPFPFPLPVLGVVEDLKRPASTVRVKEGVAAVICARYEE